MYFSQGNKSEHWCVVTWRWKFALEKWLETHHWYVAHVHPSSKKNQVPPQTHPGCYRIKLRWESQPFLSWLRKRDRWNDVQVVQRYTNTYIINLPHIFIIFHFIDIYVYVMPIHIHSSFRIKLNFACFIFADFLSAITNCFLIMLSKDLDYSKAPGISSFYRKLIQKLFHNCGSLFVYLMDKFMSSLTSKIVNTHNNNYNTAYAKLKIPRRIIIFMAIPMRT